MRKIKRYFIPGQEGARAHALRHEALLGYAVFLFLLQFSFQYFAARFPGVLGFASNIAVRDVIDLTNKQRLEGNLPPLRVSDQLTVAARAKASDMFAKNYWAHISPDGLKPWSFITNSGYSYVYAGENLAKDFQNSFDVVKAWVASPAHRENLLSSRYNDIGVAVVNGTLGGFETTLVVQMFGASQAPAEGLAAVPPAIENLPEGPARGRELQPRTIAGPVLQSPEAAAPPTARILAEPQYEVLEPERPFSPVIDILRFAKGISFAFGFSLLGLFVIDGIVVLRKRHVRLSGHTLAHTAILLLLLGATWYTIVGTVL